MRARNNLLGLMAFVLLVGVDPVRAFPIKSSGSLEFWLDAAAFNADSGQVWQEFYWSVRSGGFSPLDTMGRRMVRFRTEIWLSDSSGRPVMNENWNTLSPLPSEKALRDKDMAMLDQLVASRLTPGNYRLSMTIRDLAGPGLGSIDTSFELSGFTGPSLSQVELASFIGPDTLPGRFRKGGLTVKPWPERIFNDYLYYYYEAYNLPAVVDTLKPRFLRVMYLSSDDPAPKIITNRDISGISGQLTDYGGLKTDDLPEGQYRLRIQIIEGSKALAGSYANFRIVHPPLAPTPEKDQIAREVEQLERDGGEYFARIEYLATNEQLALLKKLDENGRKELLRRFWKQRDPNPETPENEALIEHAKRYRFADLNFAEKYSGGLKGSLTDRGRIYIKYGPWDDRDLTTNALQSKPTDSWSYENGRKFIFVDKAGFGKYELVYSKTSEEKTDPKYRELISDY